MSVPSVDKLEETYTKLLRVVYKEVSRLEKLEALENGDLRALETVDKVLRSALDYAATKPPEDSLSGKSEEELLAMIGE